MRLALARLGRAFGVLPHTLEHLTPYEISFDLACLDELDEWTRTRIESCPHAFPVAVLNG